MAMILAFGEKNKLLNNIIKSFIDTLSRRYYGMTSWMIYNTGFSIDELKISLKCFIHNILMFK